mgnify:CR=1 FL=1
MRGASPEIVIQTCVWRAGAWQPHTVRGTTLESFRPVVRELGQPVGQRIRELREARCMLGATLLKIKSQVPYGEWDAWLTNQEINEKTLRASVAMAEQLCDADGKIVRAKVQAARARKPHVRIDVDDEDISLRQAEQLVGQRGALNRQAIADIDPSDANAFRLMRIHTDAKSRATASDSVSVQPWKAATRLAAAAAASPEPVAIGPQMTLEELRVATRAKCANLQSKINELSADQLARLLTALDGVA